MAKLLNKNNKLVLLFFVSCFLIINDLKADNSLLNSSLGNQLLINNYLSTGIPLFLMPQNFVQKDIFKKDSSIYKPTMLPDAPTRFHHTRYRYNENLPLNYGIKSYIDSNDYSVRYREEFEGNPTSPESNADLDTYLNSRKQQIQSQIWDSTTADYDLKKALSRGDLSRMIASSTGFSIPLPPNPISSIFGDPKISLNVNGEVNVRIGWRWDVRNLGTVSRFGQTQSTPVFSQDIRVNVSGGIGDKLRISTDWNTRRSFDLNNTFKIGFEGEDDDIIKLIEVGNVSLPTYNSLIGGGQTLFGVRADFQFGPLYLKTILSQRRGERKFVDVKGGENRIPFQIRAYDYARNYFFISEEFKQIWTEYFKVSTPVLPIQFDSLTVKEIQVWESTTQVVNTQVRNVIAFSTLDKIPRKGSYPATLNQTPIQVGDVERGRFQLLDSTKWDFDYTLGVLRIENLSPDKTYAVAYRLQGPSRELEDDVQVGYFAEERGFDQELILQLVSRPNLQPGFKTLWSRQMRNIFNISANNIQADQATINVWYINQSNDSVDVLEGTNEKLVTIFGVDRTNPTGQATPDGSFDKIFPYFDAKRGEIRFPSLEPFRQGLIDYFDKIGKKQLADRYIFSAVYDTTYEVAKQNTVRDRFVVAGEVSGSSNSRIRLGAFNLAPNSVRITLDGVELKEYQDYTVDYFSGTVQLRNPRASLPNANLKIEYEQQDIFQVSTKTMAGVRADYNLFNRRRIRSDLGFTFLYYNQSAVQDQVTLGQEPISNSMFGFDARLNWDTPFITKALDLLPFYDTKAKSNFDLLAEWAMMMPEPNKRKSVIPTDNGESVVYIDNFEGAQRRITLGLNPTLWTHASAPVDSTIDPVYSNRSNWRGRTYWHQKFIPYIAIRDIYPDKETYVGQNNLAPLEIDFNPEIRGIYNRNPDFVDELNPNYDTLGHLNYLASTDANGLRVRDKMWGGMMRLFSSFNTNFDTENIEYLEIMMYIDGPTDVANAKVYLDIGQISEDVIPNDRLDTEDGITAASPLVNQLIDAGEDVGIDGIGNEDERNSTDPTKAYPFPLNLEADPARDDYFFNFTKDISAQVETDFLKYNNYENNAAQSETGVFPDTEVLNLNNGQTVALDNSYFRYEIKIDRLDASNPQIVGGNPSKGWYLYRIPIRKPTLRVGNPLFSNIQYIRFSAKGGRFKAKIADWALVGSQWQRISTFQSGVNTDDSVMSVQFINLFENQGPPDFYTMPPGVRAPQQINSPNPQQNISLNEQSLKVCVNNLKYDEERMSVRIFQQLDLFYYKKMKFFIHGDGSMPIGNDVSNIPKAYVFLRFGVDSSNYYEYRKPITRDWDDIEVDLQKLTSIKQIRDVSRIIDRQEFPTGNDDGSTYAIKGTPIITRVKFFGIGIANPAERFPNDLNTCIWLDELRLIDAEDSNDWAANLNGNLKLADIGTINASIQSRQPNFHRLEERFGNRNNANQFTVTMQGNLEKFMPKSFTGAKFPITYTHAEQLTTPVFVANSDVNLQESADLARNIAIQQGATQKEADGIANSIIKRSETLIVQDAWALTGVKLGIPVKHWSVSETINKINFDYSYSQQYERTQIYENRFNWNWIFNMTYANSIPELLTLSPYKFLDGVYGLGTYSNFKINFLPSNIGWGLSFNRSRQTEQSRFLTFASPIIRNFANDRKANFTWKFIEGGFINPTFDYSLNTRSTLVPLEFNQNGAQRTGAEIFDNMFFKNDIIDFGSNTQHQQKVTINFKPTLPDFFYISRFFDMNGSYDSDYAWNDPLQPDPAIQAAARNATYNSNLKFKLDIGLKNLADIWFGMTPKGQFDRKLASDTTITSGSILRQVGAVFKFIFLDYENLNFRFTQNNGSTNPGVVGDEGLSNFWGRGLTFRESLPEFGPSFAYQLGLVSNPGGTVNFTPNNGFPYFGFGTTPGLRPANGRFQDNYRQSNDLNLSTSRPLWKNATLDLTWKSRLTYNRNQTVLTDANGVPEFTNIIANETFDRSFISLPTVFGLNLFGNTVEDVVAIYEAKAAVINNDNTKDSIDKNRALNVALAESFYEGLEAFSLSGTGRVAKFLPAMNWQIRWTGIEEWEMWDGYLKKVQVDHGYVSNYSESVIINDNGRSIQNQQVQSGFSPLIGITTSFDESKVGGTLTASVKWNRTQGYNLNIASKSIITSQVANEIQMQANYTLKSLEFEWLGIKLKNNIEFSFIGSYKYNGRGTFDVFDQNSFAGGEEQGRVLDGSTVINIEPRVRYTLSDRITASFFVRYDGTFNEGASTPGFSTTQVGLDFRMSIAGGR